MNKGFSLTEMSIVIVIMALIAAAIMGGKSLLEAAKINAIVAEYSEHSTSFNNFYVKYDDFAGDFRNAEGFWGAANTDNGDGDGKIEFKQGSVYESYRAWQHMALAGMTKGEYMGAQTTSVPVIGTDVPPSKTQGGAYFLEYGVHNFTTDNALILGVPVATSASPTLVNGILTQIQAFSVDSKLDDGEPLTGSVRGKDGNSSAAQACVDSTNRIYKIASSSRDCTVAFRMYKQ